MLANILREALRRKPFQPFVLIDSNGDKRTISHPERLIESSGGEFIAMVGGDYLPTQIATEALSEIRIDSACGEGSPWPFVAGVHWFKEVDSTSDVARRIVDKDDLRLPLLIGADRQTRGRGRGDHRWWSDSGSLTLTLVLDPAAHGLAVSHEPKLALATAVAIIDAIEILYPQCRPGLRWPNDVEVGGRKLGGLLPERVETQHGPRILIGIGLNVQTRLEHAPPEVARMAASLTEWEPVFKDTDPASLVVRTILERFARVVPELVSGSESLSGRWASLDQLFGRPVRILQGTSILEGVGCGIDDAGALRVLRGTEVVTVVGGQVLR